MSVSFPMYLRNETRGAWQNYWELLRAEICTPPHFFEQDIPAQLSEPEDLYAHWQSPGLILSQSCSLPFRTQLNGQVCLLGSFDFDLPGCTPGYYNSVLVMKDGCDPGDWSGLRLAYNGADSQSGWAAPLEFINEMDARFASGLETGSHRGAAKAVAEGRADIAAIDAQTFALLKQYDPWVNQLREVARTKPTPGLPLITSFDRQAEEMGAALTQVSKSLPDDLKKTLGIRGFVQMDEELYTSLEVPEAPDTYFANAGVNG